MEIHSPTNISMHYLLQFVFNKLSNTEMDKLELLLQNDGFYADIVDDLIDLVKDRNFNFDEANAYLKKINTNDFLLKIRLKLKALSDQFNFEKLSLDEFETKAKQWFTPTPPMEFGVALMSNELEVLSPVNDQNYDLKIEFTIAQPLAKENKIFLNIFESGHEIPVIENVLEANTTTINIAKKKLHPGIYYWRMQALQTGTKAEGQFYINKQLNPFEE